MVLKKISRKILPVLVALVVLLNAVPIRADAVASGADSLSSSGYTVSGSWTFFESPYYDDDFSLFLDFSWNGSEYECIDWFLADEEIWFLGADDSDDKCVYASSSWNVDLPTITFSESYSVSADNYEFLCGLAAPIASTYFTTEIIVGGRSFTWQALSSSPEIIVNVTSSGLLMTYGTSSSQTFIYSGDDEFLGVVDHNGITRSVGSSFVVSSVSGASRSVSFQVLSEPAADTYRYLIYVDDVLCLEFESSASSCAITLINNSDSYRVFVSGYEESYSYSEEVSSVDGSRFAGMCSNDTADAVDWGIGSHSFTLSSSNPTRYFYTTFEHEITIDPAGGSYDGSTDSSSVWVVNDCSLYVPGLSSPTREGYTFSGWSFSGDGVYNSSTGYLSEVQGSGTLTANWSYSPTVKTATFIYDGKSYVFNGTADALPEVSMTVNGGTLSFVSGETAYHIEFDPAVIYGFKLEPAADLSFQVGETLIFPSDYSTDSYSQTIYPCYVSSADFISTVIVYDENGTRLTEFQFTAKGASPSLTLTVTEVGFSLSDGSNIERLDISARYDSLAGFADSPDDDVPDYLVSGSYLLNGVDGESVTYSLYVVPGDSAEHQMIPVVISMFFSTFVKPISVFYNAEFIPGFSFGRLALVAFLFGLLFWFLKVTK